MSSLTLVIANRRYSSWSLRPWLMLRHIGAAFDEVLIPLRQPDTKAEILKHSPAGKVPVLHHGEAVVWESLAIGEYLAETFPEARLLPEGRAARSLCRSISAEMHAGFADLRRALPMDLLRSGPAVALDPETAADVARVTELWRDARTRFGQGGPFLFGHFTLADAMYAPVCTRFASYGVELDPVCRGYADAVLGLPAMQEWYAAARAEPWVLY